MSSRAMRAGSGEDTLAKTGTDSPSTWAEEEEGDRMPPLLLLFQLCCISAIEGMDIGLLPATTLALQKSLDLRLTQIATMSLAQAVMQALAAPVWGVMADRKVVRRKTLLSVGAFFQGLCVVALSWTEGYYLMIFLRSVNGAMLASLKPVCVGIVADTTSELNRGKIYGYLQFFVTVGMMLVALIATPMSQATIAGFEGWRVAFVLIGGFAIFTAFLVKVFMHEVRQQKTWDEGAKKGGCEGFKDELRKLAIYFTMPTFLCLIAQGVFGAVPWNAFNFATLYFQVSGMSDNAAASLTTIFQVACAFGNILGGMVGDAMARKCPDHGRPFTANISVTCGILPVYLIFMTRGSYWVNMMLLIFMGLSATWCGVGVNWPILSEIVDPRSRSGIMAWESALEGAVAAVLGNAAVGFLAQNLFGYNLAEAEAAKTEGGNENNAAALGKALALTSVLPWLLCLLFFIFLHCAYPRDKRRVAQEKQQYLEEHGGRYAESESSSGSDNEDDYLEYLG
ncbi:unnamed protein product [Effrenium voratum]|uniref:Major facilitator superfamily (MFS) profile domain-containing protein n=1 Tax=Effrenium voratum TaxID=2562239 RepID=A0AA36HZX2_9DINO|nr:unnamed protein product [Effrenium voratum]